MASIISRGVSFIKLEKIVCLPVCVCVCVFHKLRHDVCVTHAAPAALTALPTVDPAWAAAPAARPRRRAPHRRGSCVPPRKCAAQTYIHPPQLLFGRWYRTRTKTVHVGVDRTVHVGVGC